MNLFRSERYQERGGHIAEMRRRQFGRTQVNDAIESILKADKDYPLIQLWFGDPSAYPGLDAYERVHSFLRMFINFHSPSDYSRYMLNGYGPFVDQLRKGSSRHEEGYVRLPLQDVAVYITPGVAGALRMICPAILLPPGARDGERDNVVMPKYTYLSHMAEAAFALSEVRTCRLDRSGYIDLDHLGSIMDRNTMAVMLATVGNPLSVATPPELFDDMIRLVRRKMEEYNHPIVVVADVIYEFFRRRRAERIDAIQRVARLGLDVPIIETSSFSKGMAMAGQRVGFFRFYWAEDTDFRDARHDALLALEAIYGTTLDPVSSLLQKALGELYSAINYRRHKEEDVATTAAVLTALDELTKMKGRGDTFTMMPDEVPEEILRKVGADPGVWFTTSAVAKRTRKLASECLRGYDIDMKTERVEQIGQTLKRSGLIEEKVITVGRDRMMEILLASVVRYSNPEGKLIAALKEGLRKNGATVSDSAVLGGVRAQMAALCGVPPIPDDPDIMASDIRKQEDEEQEVRLVLYKLKDGVEVPAVKRKQDGQLDLYGIATDPKYPTYEDWKSISRRCGIPTEDELYERFKTARREEVFSRVDFLATEFEKLRQEKLGISMYPGYYDAHGNLDTSMISGFYLLVRFDLLGDSPCQAAEVVQLCNSLGLPLLGTTPGEVFLTLPDRETEKSYIRIVALLPKAEAERVVEIVRTIAIELAHEEALRSASPGHDDPAE